MVNVEDISEQELDQLNKFYIELSKLSEKEDDLTCTHSIDAAEEVHHSKQDIFKSRQSYAASRDDRDSSKAKIVK